MGNNWVTQGLPIQSTVNALYELSLPSGISITTQFKATPVGCQTLPEAFFTVTVEETAGKTYGNREVGAGNNEGTVMVADYTGAIAGWQSSEDNGITWSSINETEDELSYSSLIQTTLYRAKVQTCSGVLYSEPCTIRIREINWTEELSYDEAGEVTGATRAYFDAVGKALQTQRKNITAGKILASQPLYDSYDQSVGSTLSAPTKSPEFEYDPLFFTSQSEPTVPYSYKHFDNWTTVTAPQPAAVAMPGTLGWYYSTNNTLEPYTAVTAYPYSRTQSAPDGSTGVVRASMPGDAFRLGQNKETVSGSFAVRAELDAYLALKNRYFPASEMGASVTTLSMAATQQVSRDAHGQLSVSIQDKEGHSLMQARPGENTELTIVQSSVEIGWPYRLQIAASELALSPIIAATADIMVYDGNEVLVYTGPATGYSIPTSGYTGQYYFYSTDPFTIATPYIDTTGPIPVLKHEDYVAQSREAYSFYNFCTFSAGAISIELLSGAAQYELVNSVTGGVVTDITALPAGFYQIRSKRGTLKLTYTNVYQDISYSFYNQKGQLIGTLAPNGVKLLADAQKAGTLESTYPTRASLPFFTSYEYDTQGRLLAVTETDAGRTEYLYRTDGKLRFSQNALQRTTGYFSYVTYDAVGRIVEAGEARPTASQPNYFASLRNDQGAIDTGEFTDVRHRVDVTTTVYDVSYETYGRSNYTQEFLDGRVSTTIKYYDVLLGSHSLTTSQTWYSYDEQGRAKWLIKRIKDHPTRTIDYTYTFNGSVGSVCYQKDTPLERLTHYYTYNKDQQLVKVETGNDDPAAPIGPHTEQVRYQYYMHSPLKRVVYNKDLQGLDYTYTAQGWLKSVNDADLQHDPGKDGVVNPDGKPDVILPDLFGMSLSYYNSDYKSAAVPTSQTTLPIAYPERFNGTIQANIWQTPTRPISAYGYQYTDRGELKQSNYGLVASTGNRQYSFTADLTGVYSEGNLAYDPNGNLTRLTRNEGLSGPGMNIDYSYLGINANTNKLTAVKQHASNQEVIKYTYDQLGQMTAQQEVQDAAKNKYLDYDVSGKVTAVYQDAAKTSAVAKYIYDEFGRRVIKQDYLHLIHGGPTETYYVQDAAGNELASYVTDATTRQVKLYEQPLYGATRVGLIRQPLNDQPGQQLYELNDQLGNTRIVFRRPTTQTYLATMEECQLCPEKQDFNFPTSTVRTTAFAHGGSSYSVQLGEDNTQGPSKTLQVDRGDKIKIEVYAAYPNQDGGIFRAATPFVLAGAVVAGTSTTVPTPEHARVQPPTWRKALNTLSFGLLIPLGSGKNRALAPPVEQQVPNAALQYVVRSKRGAFLSNQTIPVSTTAEGNWEKLTYELEVDSMGTVEVSVNTYGITDRVYFDDLKIEHTTGPLVEENHFYAYGQRNAGLSWTRRYLDSYQHGYQGQFSKFDSETGYNSFDLRLYDARIGRWMSVDPKRQHFSPYIGMGNNPVSRSDKDGGEDHEYTYDVKTGQKTYVNNRGGSEYDIIHNGYQEGTSFVQTAADQVISYGLSGGDVGINAYSPWNPQILGGELAWSPNAYGMGFSMKLGLAINNTELMLYGALDSGLSGSDTFRPSFNVSPSFSFFAADKTTPAAPSNTLEPVLGRSFYQSAALGPLSFGRSLGIKTESNNTVAPDGYTTYSVGVSSGLGYSTGQTNTVPLLRFNNPLAK
ncbi:RHS repeat protein [Hymenobacter elongatus]|uniref:RHS repeat protein n=1 Tax=Hymenobacter elongatus TaxID=877208 RepID=UPI0014369CC4|nr:RHS repeat-associated core domain-containing protein [Hymenobacter elongatus]